VEEILGQRVGEYDELGTLDGCVLGRTDFDGFVDGNNEGIPV